MNFSNWFRITWWALLFLTVGAFLWHRFPALAAGAATPADVVIFLVWVALGLAPVFKEVSLFGVGLKQEMKDLRADLHGLRAEVRRPWRLRAVVVVGWDPKAEPVAFFRDHPKYGDGLSGFHS